MNAHAPKTSEPRWLNSAEMDAWLNLAQLVARLPLQLEAQLQRDAGLTHFEYLVLSALSEAPHRTMRMSALAGLAFGSPSRLSHVVKRLEARGWIQRVPDEEDGRITNAVLTDSGWDKVVATAPGHVENVRALVIDPLTTTQVHNLSEIGRVLNAVIDPNAQEAVAERVQQASP